MFNKDAIKINIFKIKWNALKQENTFFSDICTQTQVITYILKALEVYSFYYTCVSWEMSHIETTTLAERQMNSGWLSRQLKKEKNT